MYVNLLVSTLQVLSFFDFSLKTNLFTYLEYSNHSYSHTHELRKVVILVVVITAGNGRTMFNGSGFMQPTNGHNDFRCSSSKTNAVLTLH
jgi:hypothetical protein